MLCASLHKAVFLIYIFLPYQKKTVETNDTMGRIPKNKKDITHIAKKFYETNILHQLQKETT